MVFFRLNVQSLLKQLHEHIQERKFRRLYVLMTQLLKALLLRVQAESDKFHLSYASKFFY